MPIRGRGCGMSPTGIAIGSGSEGLAPEVGGSAESCGVVDRGPVGGEPCGAMLPGPRMLVPCGSEFNWPMPGSGFICAMPDGIPPRGKAFICGV